MDEQEKRINARREEGVCVHSLLPVWTRLQERKAVRRAVRLVTACMHVLYALCECVKGVKARAHVKARARHVVAQQQQHIHRNSRKYFARVTAFRTAPSF